MLSAETVDDTLGAIYDAALTEAAWPAALTKMSVLFGCHFADMFQRANDYSSWRGIQVGLDERDYQDVFLGYWVKNNVWGNRRPTRRSGDIVVTRDMITDSELERSEMYCQYLQPRGLESGLRLDIWAGKGGVEDVSLLRPWSAGPYTQEELRAAALLLPHLQRAAMMRRRMAEADGLATAGLACLEQVRMGVLLLGQNGRVMHANRAAEDVLRSGEALLSGAEGLKAPNAASDRALQSMIRAATGKRGGVGRSGAVRLADASGDASLLAVAMPVSPAGPAEGSLPIGHATPAAFLCLIDRAIHRAPLAEHLVGLFGLTPSEATLAGQVLAGLEVHEIARQTGRSVNTVRSLLSRLMAKTDTNRQAELVRLLGMMPFG